MWLLLCFALVIQSVQSANTHAIVLLCDSVKFPETVVLSMSLLNAADRAKKTIDIVVLTRKLSDSETRVLEHSPVLGSRVKIQECSYMEFSTHFCKFDLFVLPVFRAYENVLYMDSDLFLLDGDSLLHILFEPSGDKVFSPSTLLGRHTTEVFPMHNDFLPEARSEVDQVFGTDKIFYITCIVRFDPRSLPTREHMQLRIAAAMRRWREKSAFAEQGVLNALLASKRAEIPRDIFERSVVHACCMYKPDNIPFAASFAEAAGVDLANAVGCAYFTGDARSIFTC